MRIKKRPIDIQNLQAKIAKSHDVHNLNTVQYRINNKADNKKVIKICNNM